MTHFDIGGVGSRGEVGEDNLALVQIPLKELILDEVTSCISISVRTWREIDNYLHTHILTNSLTIVLAEVETQVTIRVENLVLEKIHLVQEENLVCVCV